MAIEAVLAKLAEDERAEVMAVIEAEKNRGIEESRRKGKDVSKWMTQYNALRDTLRTLELDPDSDLVDQIEGLKGAAQSKPKTDLEKQVLTLGKQVKILTEQATQKEKALQEKDQKYKTSRLTATLQSAIGDKVHASDYVIDGLIRSGKVRLDDDDAPMWVDGEQEVDFKTGVDQFLKTNPGIIRNMTRPGAGTQPGPGGSTKTITRAEFDSLAAVDKMAWVKDGGKIT